MLTKILKSFNPFSSRLSRKIILWIFGSIVVIETIIVVPSVQKREKELVAQLQEISFIKISWLLMNQTQGTDQEFLDQLKNLEITSNLGTVNGLALYQQNNQLIGTDGETPPLRPQDFTPQENFIKTNSPQKRYNVIFTERNLSHNYKLILSYDGNLIQQELWYYKGRIFLLVIVISIFVTGVMMIVLNNTVIVPILQLRDDLIKAPEVLNQVHQKNVFHSNYIKRNDELGQVMSAFQEMFVRVWEAESILKKEQEKSEQLLLNILPETIAQELKENPNCIAQSFPEVTILFADLVGFTQLSQNISPQELIELLNQIFSSFDQLCDQYHLEKIKTIGDAYMVAGGIPIPKVDHALAIADLALAMQEKITELNQIHNTALSIRIGINTGNAIAGVIGKKKFSYDLWGDAVNTASRMESHGIPGTIQVTQNTYNKLKEDYIFEDRGLIEIKGKGQMPTYLLLQKRKIS
jgi:adenylate cyclase